jgi:hypothetical protein
LELSNELDSYAYVEFLLINISFVLFIKRNIKKEAATKIVKNK